MKNGNEAGIDVLVDSRRRYREKGIRTALRTNQFAGFVTVLSEKKIIIFR